MDNCKMKKIIGTLMIITPFVVMYIIFSMMIGWLEFAAIVFGAFGIVLWVGIAVVLLSNEE